MKSPPSGIRNLGDPNRSNTLLTAGGWFVKLNRKNDFIFHKILCFYWEYLVLFKKHLFQNNFEKQLRPQINGEQIPPKTDKLQKISNDISHSTVQLCRTGGDATRVKPTDHLVAVSLPEAPCLCTLGLNYRPVPLWTS